MQADENENENENENEEEEEWLVAGSEGELQAPHNGGAIFLDDVGIDT